MISRQLERASVASKKFHGRENQNARWGNHVDHGEGWRGGAFHAEHGITARGICPPHDRSIAGRRMGRNSLAARRQGGRDQLETFLRLPASRAGLGPSCRQESI